MGNQVQARKLFAARPRQRRVNTESVATLDIVQCGRRLAEVDLEVSDLLDVANRLARGERLRRPTSRQEVTNAASYIVVGAAFLGFPLMLPAALLKDNPVASLWAEGVGWAAFALMATLAMVGVGIWLVRGASIPGLREGPRRTAAALRIVQSHVTEIPMNDTPRTLAGEG